MTIGSRRLGSGLFGRLRPRLVLTFALVAALTAVTVAWSSYLVVRELRLRDETDAAVEQGTFNLELAAATLAEGSTATELDAAVRSLQRRGGFDVVALWGDVSSQTSLSIGPGAVPEDLRALAEQGRIASARRAIDGRSFVVVGGPVTEGAADGAPPVEIWSYFPVDDVFDDLATLGRVLAAVTAVAVTLSGVVGVLAGRALLRPIGRARDAARSIGAGDLTVRLPDAGSDELTDLSRSFNDMALTLEATISELRAAEDGQRRFVADVSHELRTPVTALAIAAEALEPSVGSLPEREQRAARLLVTEAMRLRTLVEDLMEISRFDAGAASLTTEPTDLRRFLESSTRDHSWSGVVEVRPGPAAVVQIDRRRLHRVLANLVGNALRHGAPPVEVAADTVGQDLVIEVRDHGPGIAEEHLPHLFDRFFKADVARRRSPGSGLGLAIAAEDVALHGGTLRAANHPDGGAVLRIELPGTVAEPLPGGEGAVTIPDDRDVGHPSYRKDP